MNDAALVSHPQIFPSQCLCGSQKGPILDTFIEKHGDRIYICRLCAQAIARKYGFADGAELDKLMGARELLDQAEREAAEKDRLMLNYQGSIHQLEAKLKEAEEERDHALGEVKQYRHIARAIERQSHELVGGNVTETG